MARGWRSPARSILTGVLLASLVPAASLAAQGDCGQPMSTGATPTASDCLFILRTAVGSQVCDPVCICDTNGAGGTSATDALLCLKAAVAEPVTLSCPCETIGEASIAIAINPNPAFPGEILEVQLTVTNSGITDLETTQVDLAIPQGLDDFSVLTPRSAPVACVGPITASACSPGETVRWSVGALAPGDFAVLSIAPTVLADPAPNDGAEIVFAATVLASGLPLAASQASTFVDSSRTLDLSLDDDRDPVAPGGPLLYRLSLGNRAGAASQDTVLRMPLPSGTTFVSASDNGVLGGDDVVAWQMGDLGAGATAVREVVVTTDGFDAEGGEITASATIENGAGERVESVVVTEVRENAPLAVTMTLVPDPARQNEVVAGTLSVANRGAVSLDGVTAEVTLPQHLANFFLIDVSGSAAECVGVFTANSCAIGETLEWTVGTLEAGGSVTLTMPPVLGPNVPPGTVITFEARARDGGNLEAGARESVRVAGERLLDLSIEDDVDPAAPGDEIRYEMSYGNLGAVAANNVSLRVPVPDGAAFAGALDGGVLIGDAVEWDLGFLPAGETGTREMWLTANAGLTDGSIISVEAEISDDAGSHSRAAADTRIQAAVPLVLTMELHPDPAKSDEAVIGVLTASNVGDATLTGVEVEVILPQEHDEFPLVETSGAAAECLGTYIATTCAAGERLLWTLGDLPPGAGLTLSMPAKMASALISGSVSTFAARARAAGGINVALNESVRIESTRSLDLSVSDGDGDPAIPGGAITYRLSVGNPSATFLDAVDLRLQLPAAASFVSASDGGAVDETAIVDGTVVWNVGPLDPGATRTRECIAQLDTGLPSGSILDARAKAETATGARTLASAATRIEEGVPLLLAIELGPDPAAPDKTVTGVLTATNIGPVALDGVEVEVMLPQQTANFYLIGASGGTSQCRGPLTAETCSAGERLVWTVGTLAAGQGVTLTMPPPVKAATSDGSVMTFEARGRASGGVNTAARASVRIESPPGLELTLEDGGGDPAIPGSELTYEILFGNPTGFTASNSVLRMAVPAGTTFVSASGGGALGADGVVEWSLGSIGGASNGRRTLTVSIDPALDDGAMIRGLARLDDNAGSRAEASADTRIEADSPLTLTLSMAPQQAAPGEAITGTLVVGNLGGVSLDGVEVEVILPEEMSTFSVAAPTGATAACVGTFTASSCAPGERLVFSVGTLSALTDAVLTFPPKVASGIAAGTLMVFEARAHAADGANAALRRTVRVTP
jgi:uncharacterized repeat protein (TIGR01451 family)